MRASHLFDTMRAFKKKFSVTGVPLSKPSYVHLSHNSNLSICTGLLLGCVFVEQDTAQPRLEPALLPPVQGLKVAEHCAVPSIAADRSLGRTVQFVADSID